MAKKKKPDTLPFLVVARTAPGHYPHPVEVAVHPDGANSLVSFSIGPHAVNAGGQVMLYRVIDGSRSELSPLFAQEFDAAELHWLVPLLVRLQNGEDVKADIVSAYRALHGKSPEIMQQGRYAF